MNTLDFLSAINTPSTAATPPAGAVFIIRCEPDPFTGERFNIGVCGVSAQGKRLVKVITEPGRLKCFYGEHANMVVALAAVAKDAAERGLPPPSAQIIFDEPSPYYNSTLTALVQHTFDDQVTAALPHRPGPQPENIDDDQALELVGNAIKTRQAFSLELLANTPQVLVQTDCGPRTLRIPLQPRNGVGTIRSAYYSAATLKTHLMDSVLDLECAARYRQKRAMGLFILRPKNAAKDVNRQLDAVIDNILYRTPRNMMLEVGYSTDELAEYITAWAKTSSD